MSEDRSPDEKVEVMTMSPPASATNGGALFTHCPSIVLSFRQWPPTYLRHMIMRKESVIQEFLPFSRHSQ